MGLKEKVVVWLVKRMSYEQKAEMIKKVAPEFFQTLTPEQRVDLFKQIIPTLLNDALDAQTIADLIIEFPKIKDEITKEIGKSFFKGIASLFKKG